MWSGENHSRKGNKMKKNKWIYVNDRLPSRDKPVLTVRIRRTTGKPYVAMDLLSVDNQWIYQMQDITMYWRPLPELPKELEMLLLTRKRTNKLFADNKFMR